jgi:hypothetical protein
MQDMQNDARHPNYLKGNTAVSHTLPCVRRAPAEPFDASRGKPSVTHCRLYFPSRSRNSEVHTTRTFYASVNSTELGHRILSTAAVLLGYFKGTKDMLHTVLFGCKYVRCMTKA